MADILKIGQNLVGSYLCFYKLCTNAPWEGQTDRHTDATKYIISLLLYLL